MESLSLVPGALPVDAQAGTGLFLLAEPGDPGRIAPIALSSRFNSDAACTI
jgi:hypothetical protein